ncbi:heme NO-binding domain-containing protein [Marivita sp. S6314]|nr:heme NO-binding domain-containing protein [Marivita sp. S6314]
MTEGFGADRWQAGLARADVDVLTFEAMFDYDDAYLPKVLEGCAAVLDRSVSSLLEDVGTYLITQQNHASVRRLMRFGGDSFVELLHALDDLPGRTRLAVSGLNLPQMTVREHTPLSFVIYCDGPPIGFGHVLVGLLRAMADDYGALALVDHRGFRDGAEVIEASVIDTSFAADRGFSLATSGTGEGT